MIPQRQSSVARQDGPSSDLLEGHIVGARRRDGIAQQRYRSRVILRRVRAEGMQEHLDDRTLARRIRVVVAEAGIGQLLLRNGDVTGERGSLEGFEHREPARCRIDRSQGDGRRQQHRRGR